MFRCGSASTQVQRPPVKSEISHGLQQCVGYTENSGLRKSQPRYDCGTNNSLAHFLQLVSKWKRNPPLLAVGSDIRGAIRIVPFQASRETLHVSISDKLEIILEFREDVWELGFQHDRAIQRGLGGGEVDVRDVVLQLSHSGQIDVVKLEAQLLEQFYKLGLPEAPRDPPDHYRGASFNRRHFRAGLDSEAGHAARAKEGRLHGDGKVEASVLVGRGVGLHC